ncbi:MAG: hypothetical protein ACK4HF_07550 [Paracoccaceae bacterium]
MPASIAPPAAKSHAPSALILAAAALALLTARAFGYIKAMARIATRTAITRQESRVGSDPWVKTKSEVV